MNIELLCLIGNTGDHKTTSLVNWIGRFLCYRKNQPHSAVEKLTYCIIFKGKMNIECTL